MRRYVDWIFLNFSVKKSKFSIRLIFEILSKLHCENFHSMGKKLKKSRTFYVLMHKNRHFLLICPNFRNFPPLLSDIVSKSVPPSPLTAFIGFLLQKCASSRRIWFITSLLLRIYVSSGAISAPGEFAAISRGLFLRILLGAKKAKVFRIFSLFFHARFGR